MENINAEQVIDILDKMDFFEGHIANFSMDISLIKEYINSQEQKIKELGEENDQLYRLVDDKIQENQRLACLSKATAEVSKTIRNEVIDEFADMVKATMREVATGKRTSLIGTGWIDEIARELKGE